MDGVLLLQFLLFPVLALLGGVGGAVVLRFVDRNGWEVRKRSLRRPFALAIIGLGAIGLPLLYCYEVLGHVLATGAMNGTFFETWPSLKEALPDVDTDVFFRFAGHSLLFFLLLAATLIDFEDMIIPDNLTVFGTVGGLSLVFLMPTLLLPATEYHHFKEFVFQGSLLFWFTPRNTAFVDPLLLPGMPRAVIGVLLWYGWCFGMLHRVWYPGRLGWKRAWLLFWRRLWRTPSTKSYLLFALLGTILIPAAMLYGRPVQGHALFSALIGMAAGGGLIWTTRLIARQALGLEAMGFGDVTFMAMIGTFIGWQGSLIVFFLAPIAGVVIGLIVWLSGRGNAIPYGPYLAAATVVTILGWPFFWKRTESLFSLGLFVPIGLMVFFALLWLMLSLWLKIKQSCRPR